MLFNNTKTLFAVAVAVLCSRSFAEEETCSVGMTKFADTPANFNSIIINPSCSGSGFFTTSKLAWTIEPLEEEGAVPAIYSYPPEAVIFAIDENVLIFDLNGLDEVPDKAGVVIQVPKWQLRDVTVDGVDNHVRVAPGFPNLLTLRSLGTSSVIEADISESLYPKLVVDASNSIHSIVGENIIFQMHSVSTKVYIDGTITGGEYDGFSNTVKVTRRVRDLSVVGNKNELFAGDCASTVVDSSTSFCTVLEEGEMEFDFESIPCTYDAACGQKCVSTPYGYCHCTEQECSEDSTPKSDESKTTEEGSTSTASSVAIGTVAAVSSALAIFAAAF